MAEENRNKFWISIGRCGAFTEKDKHIFRVWPDSPQFEGNKHIDLMPKFVEASSLEDAKSKIHWFVDKMFLEYYEKYGKGSPVEALAAPIPQQQWTPPPSGTENLESLCIEGAASEPKAGNDSLLNLGDLLK